MTNWEMVKECQEYLDEMNPNQAEFIEDLFYYASEKEEDFFEETTESQRMWLYALWDFYCNGNTDAFESMEDFSL